MSTPARSIPTSNADSSSTATGSTPSGTPDLRALRAAYVGTPPPANIPPRAIPVGGAASDSNSLGVSSSYDPNSSASVSSSVPRVGGISAGKPPSPGASDPAISSSLNVRDLPQEEKAKVLRRHLVSKDERQRDSLTPGESSPSLEPEAGTSAPSRRSSSSIQPPQPPQPRREDTEHFPVHYDAPGADVTHDIYKWQSDQRKQAGRARAVSFTGVPAASRDPAFEHIHEPGGFRRNYLLLRGNEQGEEPRMLVNFVDFLYIFGHFAGEDLEEEEEGEDARDDGEADEEAVEPTERTSLLRDNKFTRSRSRSRRRAMSASEHGPHGNASVTQAVLMLLKSFVGTGVLFLGKAFYNGGILFSAGLFTFICLISLYSFILLVKTKFVVSGSFGDIGGALYGRWMRYTILLSISVSQLGFVGAYTIFVAENLHSFVLGITQCATNISVHYFILMQLVVLLPLALVRDLAKLSTTALIADVFILAGLIYIFGSEFLIIANRGLAQVELFNPRDFPLFVGTAVFSFEGIGLVIPITDAMKEPRKFPKVLSGVMVFLLFLFGGAGALAYLTFGSKIQTVVLVNLDTSNKMVQAVQFLYSLAILLSIPLQLFPAIRILETGVFTKSGKGDTRVKWLKNGFRFLIVLCTTVISWFGASDLDKFVAFVGCFACVPLCYVYPAMLHLKACARTRSDRIKDYLMIVFGLIAAAYTTVQTVRLMLEPSGGEGPIDACSLNHNP